jgi:hypothetical protein
VYLADLKAAAQAVEERLSKLRRWCKGSRFEPLGRLDFGRGPRWPCARSAFAVQWVRLLGRPRPVRARSLEALIIGSSGGLAGAVLGILSALVAAKLGSSPVTLSPGNVFLAIAVSAAAGVVFGAYPARRAAGLDPSTALRSS